MKKLKVKIVSAGLVLASFVAPAFCQTADVKAEQKAVKKEEERLTKAEEKEKIAPALLPKEELDELKQAQTKPSDAADVVVNSETLFTVRARIGPFEPASRVRALQKKITSLMANRSFDPESISVSEGPVSSDITAGNLILMSVTDLDAKLAQSESRRTLAAVYAEKLKTALVEMRKSYSVKGIMVGVLYSLLASVVLAIALSALGWTHTQLNKLLKRWRGTYIKSMKFQKATLLSEDAIVEIASGLVLLGSAFALVSMLLLYATLVFGFFSATKDLSQQLVKSSLDPIVSVIVPAVKAYLPNLLFIAVIAFVSYLMIRAARFFFMEMDKSNISFTSFDREWALPTFGIVRFLIICFGFALIFPYLPGAGSPAFNQISIFIGVLISLGSSTAISHVIAGVFLTYTSAFRVGDRVKIADTVGDIVEKRLLATRIRTVKNEYITIPNGLVLGAHIINYSASANDTGLILHSIVTIGYDVPTERVEELLIDAAKLTEGISEEPSPFVLRTELESFAVRYEINAYTRHSHEMFVLYSRLHAKILEKFNEAGIEIMTPTYTSLRDGNQTTVPSGFKPHTNLPSGFKIMQD